MGWSPRCGTAGLLGLLAEHAQLEPAPSLRPFPFRVPQFRRTQGSVRFWSPGKVQGTDDVTANARLLLWFAVAHAPDEFGADVLFWQQLLQSLHLYRREGGRIARPIVRVRDGVCNAARGLIDAAHVGVGANLAGDGERCQVDDGGDIHDPQAFSTIKSIARYLQIDASTLWRWRQKGILDVDSRDGTYICSKSQLEILRRSR